MRRVSLKRARIERERAKLNAELRDEPRRCEFPLGCTQIADCWHEFHTRGQGGSIVDRDNLRASCIAHNGWAEDNPLEAHRIGWRLLRKAA
jgi:hypothetical protein